MIIVFCRSFFLFVAGGGVGKLAEYVFGHVGERLAMMSVFVLACASAEKFRVGSG